MIQPGRETNLPSSSGSAAGASGLLSYRVGSVDGFTITLGLVVLLIVGFMLYSSFFARRRR